MSDKYEFLEEKKHFERETQNRPMKCWAISMVGRVCLIIAQSVEVSEKFTVFMNNMEPVAWINTNNIEMIFECDRETKIALALETIDESNR